MPLRSSSRGLPVVVGVVAFGLAALVALSVLSRSDWDPTVFAAFGEEAAPTRQYAEERLGEVFLRIEQGHDGKFFFVQANDPWVLTPRDNAAILDRPLYRSQRMLYPALAGGGGLFGPQGVVWGMLVVNLAALGLGSWAVAALAKEMGGSPWWGLAFVLNLGFISEMNIGGSGVVAAALAFAAVVFLIRDRLPLAVTLLALAALSREVMLIAAAGAAFWLWRRGRRSDAAATLLVPAMASALWALYLRLRIGFDTGASEVQGFTLPLAGIARSFENWLEDPVNIAVGLAMILLLLVYTRRAVMSSDLIAWAFIGFVPLALILNEQVWTSYFDITRAIAPLITAFVLLAFLGRSRVEDPARAASRH